MVGKGIVFTAFLMHMVATTCKYKLFHINDIRYHFARGDALYCRNDV